MSRAHFYCIKLKNICDIRKTITFFFNGHMYKKTGFMFE